MKRPGDNGHRSSSRQDIFIYIHIVTSDGNFPKDSHTGGSHVSYSFCYCLVGALVTRWSPVTQTLAQVVGGAREMDSKQYSKDGHRSRVLPGTSVWLFLLSLCSILWLLLESSCGIPVLWVPNSLPEAPKPSIDPPIGVQRNFQVRFQAAIYFVHSYSQYYDI